MFSCFFKLFNSTGLPYKIQTRKHELRKGIIANSLKELIKKSKRYLEVSQVERVVLEEDGTEVDDELYFRSLPAQTVFVVLQPGEQWQPSPVHSLKSVLQSLSEESLHKQELVAQLHTMLSTATSPEMVKLLRNMTEALHSSSEAETREEDPDWFEDIDKRFKTKEDYMTDNARRRVRGYYNTAKDFVKTNASKSQQTAYMLNLLLDEFKRMLADNKYHGAYFSRSQPRDSFCNTEGWFTCEGAFNEDQCDQHHVINPYSCRSERVVFSTWNLDHQLEKSREVLPCMWSAVEALSGDAASRTLNRRYFYELLFTRRNLRLVHVACHDKREHSGRKCDTKLIYL